MSIFSPKSIEAKMTTPTMTYGNASNYNWTSYPYPLYGGQPTQQESKLTKEAYKAKVQMLLDECREQIDDLREKSMRTSLNEEELETAFDVLYDAADLLTAYKNTLNAPKNDTLLISNQEKWVKPYMKDLILYGIGSTAEIRQQKNEKLFTKSGKQVDGDVINVRMLPADRRSEDVPLYNWLEVDQFFWDRDYFKADEEYSQSGYLPYDTSKITKN